MKNNIYILILLGLGLTESRAANNPFNQSPNPFGQSPFGVVANNPNPFAQSPSPFGQSPFGVVANNPNPFAQSPSPFGQSPFGVVANNPKPNPFNQAKPSPVGVVANNPNPFAQSPNPFNQAKPSPVGVVANNPNPFAQSPSPFNQASQSPFGVVANNPKPNPFGQSPFNQGASASPFLLGNQNLKPIIADSEFQKCNPEQQNSSLGYADQLIKEGKDAQFAVNVGIYMLSLYVKGFDKKRVEEIKPIIADSDFQKCTPEQQKYIFAYANRLMQEGKDAQFAVNVGIDMSSIYVKGINKKRVNYLKRIVTNSGFQKCNPEQKEYIIDYVFQMMNDRNKPQFAFKVGMDMVFLYSKKIDQMLPNQIKEVNESGGMAARDVDNFTKIKKAVEALAELMATKDSDDKPNGNYKIISDYLSKQCTLTSECRASQAMRYFLLKQRTDEKALEQNLWGHGKPNWYMKLNTKEEKKAAMKDRYGESFPKYQLYNLGKVKTFSINELKEKFDRYIERHKYTPREYAKTVTMYKAFTAIALKKINFPGKNSTKNSCKVYRVVNRTALNERYNTYAQSKKAGKNVLISHQVGESTSICGPLDWIFEGTLDKEPTPKDIHEFEVPFFRVLAAYFLHLFDDNPEYKKKGWKDSAGEIVPGVGFWDERELVCNLNGISAKVKEAENSINTWAFPVEIVRIEKEKVELKINNKMAIIAKPSDKSLLESGFVYLGTPNTDNTKWEDLISCAISDRGMVKGFTNDTRLVDIGRKLYNGKALDLQPGTEICYYYTYDNDDDTKYYVVAKKDPSIVLEEDPSIVLEEDPSIFPEEDFAIFDEEDEGE